MTKLRKQFSVACNGKVLSTYKLPGADLVLFTCSHQTMLSKIRMFSSKIDSGLFTKITRSPPKYLLLYQNMWGCVRATRSLHDEVPGICFTSWPLFFLIFLQLLLTQQLPQFYQLLYFCPTSIIVAVLIAKAGHVWVS